MVQYNTFLSIALQKLRQSKTNNVYIPVRKVVGEFFHTNYLSLFFLYFIRNFIHYIEGLAQDCGDFIANAVTAVMR